MSQPLMALASSAPDMPLYVPTSDAVICTHLLQILVANGSHMIVTGVRGCGKSLLLQQAIGGTGSRGPSMGSRGPGRMETRRCVGSVRDLWVAGDGGPGRGFELVS